MRILESVAGKVGMLVVASLVGFFGLATWYNLRVQEQASTHLLVLNGAQLADVVARSIREAMLRNDRAAIDSAIATLSGQREIERIRIIDKEGKVAYSSAKTEVGTVIDTRQEQCVTCHIQPTPPTSLSTAQMVRRTSLSGHRVLGITHIISNAPDCAEAPCHVHPTTQRLLGVLDVALRLDPYEEARKRNAIQLLVASLLGILLASVVSVVAVRRMVHTPVRAMIKSARALAHGDHSVRVPELTRDELGVLAHTFNLMSRDLEKAHSELLEWAQTLENRVEQKTDELERAQEQILQVEKLASLGRLAAVVAHEINNPLSSVVTYAKILLRRIGVREASPEGDQNAQYLESIASEASRCGEIVAQLLSFARHRGGEFTPVLLSSVVEKSVFLVNHKLEMANVEVVQELTDLPSLKADAGQLQQALMALLINACEAMDKGGTITLRTKTWDKGQVLEVEDTGPGMPPDVADKAFEPFFTTKSATSGVGLGLSVVYGIVRRHGGTIDLKTAPGKGCRFTIRLPDTPPDSVQEAAP
jgi:two-component system, NtrC family, sensor kinase